MPSGNPKVDWSKENIEKLKTMWAEGYSSPQIAAEIPNATRNAIMGRLNRLGLSGQKPKKTPKPRAPRVRTRSGAPRSTQRKEPTPQPPPAPLAPAFLRVTFADNTGCMAEVATGLYCGVKGYPFCPYHRTLMYRPKEAKPAIPAGR